jgi:hypothetical protein
MTRPNITKFQASEIKRAAKAAYFRYLASKPRPLHPGAPAEDEAANAEYAEETARLEQAAVALGVVLERDELMTHEREIFDTEFKALEDCYLGTCSGRCKSTVAP